MSYVPNRRDPLTQRIARSVRETVADPHAYSEGPSEPQLVDVARSFPEAARRRWNGRNTQHAHRVDTARLVALPEPGAVLDDDALEHLATQARRVTVADLDALIADRYSTHPIVLRRAGATDDLDTPGSARATRRLVLVVLAIAITLAALSVKYLVAPGVAP